MVYQLFLLVERVLWFKCPHSLSKDPLFCLEFVDKLSEIKYQPRTRRVGYTRLNIKGHGFEEIILHPLRGRSIVRL